MKDVVEVKSGNGWRKVNQHVIKPAKHGESRNQLRNDAPLEGKWYLTDSTAAVKYKNKSYYVSANHIYAETLHFFRVSCVFWLN